MTDNGCYLVHHNDLETPQRTFEDYPLFPECEIRSSITNNNIEYVMKLHR